MTINLTVPQNMQELRPRITVIGVGGAGCNAVNNMISADLEGVDFLVANTDGQALAHSLASRKIQLGSAITQGLGAGSKPEIGRAAAEESLEEVMAELADCNMVFITAGMGGGTGTGAAPIIARAARERGILTVGVITKPFEFEGQRRMKQAEDGIEELQAYVDTLIIVPNQNLFRLANERTTFADAFHMADAVLHQGVCGVTNLMIKPGLINLDFADIRAVMGEMGKAMMGTGEASGETRATQAAEAAINNPLLDDTTMKGANAVLINITGGMDMTLFEVDEAANRIRKEIDADATIIFGSAFDDKLEGVMRVSVVATGISTLAQSNLQHNKAAPNGAGSFTKNEPAIENIPENTEAAPMEKNSNIFRNRLDTTEIVLETLTDDFTPAASNNKITPTVELSKNCGPTIQLDITDAIGSVDAIDPLKEAATNNQAKVELSGIALAGEFTDDRATLDEKNSEDPTTARENINGTSRTNFIPAQSESLPDEETVPQSVETPVRRSSSLINKISDLWSTKPETHVSVERNEPAIVETKAALSILDLSESNIVRDDISERTTGELDVSDDALDIPAFLRRQAN
jgi:cell division protein FtsZ